MDDQLVSRRDFISLTWKSLLWLSGLIGTAALWRYFSNPVAGATRSSYDLGPIEALPSEPVTIIPEAQAVLLNTPEGFRALSQVCPHLGCLVNIAATGFSCPCHGSEFHRDGGLKKGPADQPLQTLTLSVSEAGHLILHK